MNFEAPEKSQIAKGIKMLAILSVGAASGGCWAGELTLGISKEGRETYAAMIAASEASQSSSDNDNDSGSSQGQQQQQ